MKKISLNVGDEVIIRSDLNTDERYGGVRFDRDMCKMLGRKVTISIKHHSGFYIKEYAWSYAKQMIDVDKTYKLQNKISIDEQIWIPKDKDKVWLVMCNGDYVRIKIDIKKTTYEQKFKWLENCFTSGSVFRTRELARQAKKKIEQVLKECKHG